MECKKDTSEKRIIFLTLADKSNLFDSVAAIKGVPPVTFGSDLNTLLWLFWSACEKCRSFTRGSLETYARVHAKGR